MEPLIITVQATDDRLSAFYDPLASRLEGRGSVYVPHVVIPPNARMAVRRPPRLVVGLALPDDVEEVEAWAGDYLATEGTSELHFEREGRRVVLGAADPASRRGSLRSLVSD
ncbi:MAG: hypothetical protein ACR2HV_03050 [Acidimicrobiales bacterium]